MVIPSFLRNGFVTRVANIPRRWKRAILITFDVLALSAALWASFSLRFGNWTPPTTLDQFLIILTAPIVAIPIFVRMGLYRAVIRYLPERALWTIVYATALATLCWVLVAFLSELTNRTTVPRTVPILFWAMSTAFIGGSRFFAKKLLWSTGGPRTKDRPIVIYGAGEAGVQLANALRRQGTEFIAAFIDDNANLHGRDIGGIRVHSPTSIRMLVEQYGIQEIILSMPSLTTKRRQEIVAAIGGHGAKIRTLPPIKDLVSGKYLVSHIREIDIDELLGRSSVPADPDLLRAMIEGRTIMVTGAGGSIGSELCRLITEWAPQRVVLFEANEFALYRIERELAAASDHAIVPVLGSITDTLAVHRAIKHHGVQVLFHAAAHKHVPLVEANALEGIRNNVLGTKTVADIAFELGVQNFVLISSDKAVRPTNVMGATKRWAELIVRQKDALATAAGTGQRFCAVRFGNVLGSTGSVVPLFKRQIAEGGPITLTDTAMTRYFMSIEEAAELIVQAGALSNGGDVFLLDMGEPMLISDLAENMVRLAGLTMRDANNPHGDIEILVTGKRPGEKLFEELFYDASQAKATMHAKIMSAAQTANLDITAPLTDLLAALAAQDEGRARAILFNVVHQSGL
jgi:FlaA1/EpsC-like NDP-sugar epimerase